MLPRMLLACQASHATAPAAAHAAVRVAAHVACWSTPGVAGELGPAHVEPALPLNPQKRNPI
jgi:hypothetical protein